ncbi:MAG: PLP-dependent transferase [Opitutaceae bacterium]
MSSLCHIPLGRPIPDRPHAISVSLPTMADLIGYEEKDPAVIRQVPTGYPRFVLHPFVRTLTQEFARRNGLQGCSVWLTTTPALAERLRDWLGGDARVIAEGELTGVAFAADPERHAQAKAFLQHCGGFLSSRQAEDLLAAAGLVPTPAREDTVERNPLGAVKRELRRAFTGAGDEDLFLAPNGMNAVHSAFAAVNAVQAPRGRTVWIQLGWLYLDTIAILEKFTTAPAADHVVLPAVHDLAAVRRVLEENRGRVAAIVTEAPTNPLIQCADILGLAALVREHGAHLVLDASIASPWNVDVLPHADLALASLTKYAAGDGDLLVGTVAVNPRSADAAALRVELEARVAQPYRRDLARLAREIRDVDTLLAGVNTATPRVVEFLASRAEVKRVHWALAPESRENFLRIARSPDAVGSMITFEVADGLFGRVFDRARLPKGPSFGLRTTLFCPFMVLAHYDLASKPEGRAKLVRQGLNPELLRLSVGLEPVDEIIGALAEALDAIKTS